VLEELSRRLEDGRRETSGRRERHDP